MKTQMKTKLAVVALAMGVMACQQQKPPPPPEVPAAAKVKSFTISATEVEQGQSVTLTYEVENATEVTLRTLAGATVALESATAQSGTATSVVEEDTVFVLTAYGEGGKDSAATGVVVLGDTSPLLFAATPPEIEAGEEVTLVWNAPGASSVRITVEGTEIFSSEKPSGSTQVKPTANTSYVIDAGDGRTTFANVTVRAAIHAFTASAQSVKQGESVTLSWQVGSATSVSLSADGRGEIFSASEPQMIADGTFTDTVPMTLPDNGLIHYVLRAEQGSRVLSRDITVYVGSDPRFVEAKAPPFARLGEPYEVSWKTALADALVVEVNGEVKYQALSASEVASGKYSLVTQPTPTTVVLRATNSRGGVTTSTLITAPVEAPIFNTFTASPTTASKGGDPVTLSWDVTHARHVKISVKGRYVVKEIFGYAAEKGSIQVYPNKQTTYVLEADNTIGDAITPQEVQADVTTPARLTFAPTPVPNGTPINLTGATVPGPMKAMNFALKNAAGDGFIDILATGTALPFNSGDDTVAKLIVLPEPFYIDFAGNQVGGTTLSVNINGWMVFSGSPISGPTVPSNTISSDLEPYAMAVFSEDLQAASTTKVLWQLDEVNGVKRLIVQWDDVQFWAASSKRLTFQAQLYANGEVVYAYKMMNGLSTSDIAAIGIVNGADNGPLIAPTSLQLNNNGKPSVGDTFHFWGIVPLPMPVIASTNAFEVRITIADTFIEISDSPDLLPPGQFHVSEVNYNPAASATLGEWFEIQNNTNQPIDLNGWTLNFGGTPAVKHDITQSLVIPANGVVLLAQSGVSSQNGGITPNYVYPSSVALSNTSGSISLEISGGTYSTSSWTSSVAGGAGISAKFDVPQAQMKLASSTIPVQCSGTGTYGSQTGSPGVVNTRCFPYKLVPAAANGFQSIQTTGTLVGTMNSTAADEVTASITLPKPVKAFGSTFTTLYVSSNGFLSTSSLSSASLSNPSVPSTSSPNSVIAPFWDDHQGNSTNSSVRWQQFDPDGVANSGDEYTLVSWENWKRYGYTSSLNFQVKFIDATGDIEFHFGTMTASTPDYANGLNATTWLEAPNGRWALSYNANSTSPGIQSNMGIRFQYTP